MKEPNNNATSDVKEVTGQSAEIQNTEDLTDEQWEKVFQHPRFKELNERAKTAETQLAEIKANEEKEHQKKLKEEGKLQELLEAKEKELEELRSKLSETALTSQIVATASKLNVLDTEAVVKLLDRSKLVQDKDGNFTNIPEMVETLLAEKPYLVGKNVSPNIGSTANTTTQSQSGDFVITKTELIERLKDVNWYSEHKGEIAQWQKEGRIDYTR